MNMVFTRLMAGAGAGVVSLVTINFNRIKGTPFELFLVGYGTKWARRTYNWSKMPIWDKFGYFGPKIIIFLAFGGFTPLFSPDDIKFWGHHPPIKE